MLGVVQAMLTFPFGMSPHVYRGPAGGAGRAFEERVAELAAEYGESERVAEPAWHPNAAVAACWRRGGKTITLMLERPARCGPRVLLWCPSDEERATLEDAGRTRAARLADAAGFAHDLARRFAELRVPGRSRYVPRQLLVDDLAVVPERAVALLAPFLAHADGEVRCHAVDVRLELGGGLPHVAALFDDSEKWVRHHVVESMAGYGDGSVVDALLGKLRTDADPAVRGAAAYALGHIGDPRAVPDLIHALDHDKEFDTLGHSPSLISATALDNLLGTHQTRIDHGDGFCSMAPWRPDFDLLKRQARELYERWRVGSS